MILSAAAWGNSKVGEGVTAHRDRDCKEPSVMLNQDDTRIAHAVRQVRPLPALANFAELDRMTRTDSYIEGSVQTLRSPVLNDGMTPWEGQPAAAKSEIPFMRDIKPESGVYFRTPGDVGRKCAVRPAEPAPTRLGHGAASQDTLTYQSEAGAEGPELRSSVNTPKASASERASHTRAVYLGTASLADFS
jgi:hypothetical protein